MLTSHLVRWLGFAGCLLLLVLLWRSTGVDGWLPPQSAAAARRETTSTWSQVNDNAFGLPGNGDYSSEEGFEVIVFADHLYVGMEADNALGARLWRTRDDITVPVSQSDWEEVAADTAGYPFGNPQRQQNDHIDSLSEFQGMLYVSTANRTGTLSGTLVYRSSAVHPITWTQVISAGFGDTHNTNFKDMRVFDGQLCGGTSNAVTGAQVWCTADGITWHQHNVSGFGEADNHTIWSSGVFQDAFYVGVTHARENGSLGKLFRTTSLTGTVTWSEVYSGPAGSALVTILGILDRHLYIATQSINGVVILRSNTGDPETWQRVNTPGMRFEDTHNVGVTTDGAAVYHRMLYIAVSNRESGVEVWRTAGRLQSNGQVGWEQVSDSGVGDPGNVYAQLIPFHDYLYAWTSNYSTGQQVRQAFFPDPPYQVHLPLLEH